MLDKQEWMSKNLDVTSFTNGDPITEAKTKEEWKKAGDEGKPVWCYYENDESNGKKYGKLYNFYAVNDPRGLAPKGWHIPSDSEWTLVINILGGDEIAGKKMRKKAYVENGLTQYGFCAVAGGYRADDGTFIGLGYYRNWWSSTQNDPRNAWIRSLSPAKNNVHRNTITAGTGIAVRCVKD